MMNATQEFTVGQVRASECISEGWELIRSEYWLFFAMTLVALLIAGAVPLMILLGPMYCGLYYAMLRKLDTGKSAFEDIFKGFEHFGQALIVTGIMIVPVIISLIFVYISIAALAIGAGSVDRSVEDVFFGAMFVWIVAVILIVSLVLTCLHAFITFAFPLIVDRGMGGFDAFTLSARAVWANLGAVVSLILLQFVLTFVGLLLCFFGVYLVLPVSFAAVAVAHRKIFPKIGADAWQYSRN